MLLAFSVDKKYPHIGSYDLAIYYGSHHKGDCLYITYRMDQPWMEMALFNSLHLTLILFFKSVMLTIYTEENLVQKQFSLKNC